MPMSGVQTGSRFKYFTANLAQVAATYDLCTATGTTSISRVWIFVTTAATGLTSITMQSNNTTSDVVLASTLLAVITINKNLTPVTVPFALLTGNKIQYTIVGNGSAGSITVGIEHYGGDLN